jgi:hypothetical protein
LDFKEETVLLILVLLLADLGVLDLVFGLFELLFQSYHFLLNVLIDFMSFCDLLLEFRVILKNVHDFVKLLFKHGNLFLLIIGHIFFKADFFM